MLLEFTVENFLSFRKKVTFNMRAASLGGLHPEHEIDVGSGERLLKSACLYGANASGKTNLLRAIAFVRFWIRDSVSSARVDEPIPVEPFRLSTDTYDKPSRFEILLVAGNATYRYGFAADSTRIHEEWLVQEDVGTDIPLFTRVNSEIDVLERFEEGRELKDKVRSTSLFLSVVAQFNGAIASAIVSWFQRMRIQFSSEPDLSSLLDVLSDPIRKDVFLSYVRQADLSIEDIVIEEFQPIAPDPEQVSLIAPTTVQAGSGTPDSPPVFVRRKRVRPPTVHFFHKKYDASGGDAVLESFRFGSESAGTQKFLTLLVPILETVQSGSVLLVDELDTRFHTLLVQAVVTLFNSAENSTAQIVFTTHTTSMLQRRFLRPDQVWFSEKSRRGETDLYSLVEYKLKDNEFSERDYVQGRYGAIPFLGDFRALLADKDSA
jgi:uncharacterized protein